MGDSCVYVGVPRSPVSTESSNEDVLVTLLVGQRSAAVPLEFIHIYCDLINNQNYVITE